MVKKSKGELSREKIINTSIDQFSLNGYTNTSVQVIADICDISQTTVFYHFKNKSLLFESVLNFIIAENRKLLSQALEDESDPLERLKQLLLSNIHWAYDNPSHAKVLLALFSFASSDDHFKDLCTKTIDGGRKLVLDALIPLNDSRPFSSEMSAFDLSVALQQYISSTLFQILVRNDRDLVLRQFKTALNPLLISLLYPNL